MMNWLKFAWSVISFGYANRKRIQTIASSVTDLVDPEPSQPLTHKDVEHIQRQINEATAVRVDRSKECGSCEFVTPGLRCPACLRKR